MKRPLSIQETAEAEINEGADFYDLESPGLGTAFIDEIQRVIESISRFPASSPLLKSVQAPWQVSVFVDLFGPSERDQDIGGCASKETPLLLARQAMSYHLCNRSLLRDMRTLFSVFPQYRKHPSITLPLPAGHLHGDVPT